MARDDGVRIGAGGKTMLSEAPEVEVKVVEPLATRENEKKKVEVLEERLLEERVLEERLLDVPEDPEEE